MRAETETKISRQAREPDGRMVERSKPQLFNRSFANEQSKCAAERRPSDAYQNRGTRRDPPASAGGDDVDVNVCGSRVAGAAAEPWCLAHLPLALEKESVNQNQALRSGLCKPRATPFTKRL